MTDDLLTRLTAADPVTDDADETEARQLLERIVAEDRDTPSPAPRRRRGWQRPILAVGATAMAIVLAIALIPSDKDAGLADRAYAAVTAPKLFHIVTRAETLNPDLDRPPGERSTRDVAVMETWFDGESKDVHLTARDPRTGKLLYERVVTDGREQVRLEDGALSDVAEFGEDGELRPAENPRYDPVQQAKDMLQDEDAREAGETKFEGRTVKRLVIERAPQKGSDDGDLPAIEASRGELLVDPDTNLPLLLREKTAFVRDGVREPFEVELRFETFEQVDRTPANLAKLKP